MLYTAVLILILRILWWWSNREKQEKKAFYSLIYFSVKEHLLQVDDQKEKFHQDYKIKEKEVSKAKSLDEFIWDHSESAGW